MTLIYWPWLPSAIHYFSSYYLIMVRMVASDLKKVFTHPFTPSGFFWSLQYCIFIFYPFHYHMDCVYSTLHDEYTGGNLFFLVFVCESSFIVSSRLHLSYEWIFLYLLPLTFPLPFLLRGCDWFSFTFTFLGVVLKNFTTFISSYFSFSTTVFSTTIFSC